MNVCRWCGGKTKGGSSAFCSPECTSAAIELPELVDRSTEPRNNDPKRLASPRRPWIFGMLAGTLLGVLGTMAFLSRPAAPNVPHCAVARARAQVKAVTVDFLQNGLAGMWDGRITSPDGLDPWFIDAESAEGEMLNIFANQRRHIGTELLKAEVVDVRVTPTLDHANADFYIRVEDGRGRTCLRGTFTWIQDNGTWQRARASELRQTPCRSWR